MFQFAFIRYVKGCWQFSLTPEVDISAPSCCITDVSEITDKTYQTLSAQLADAAFEKWNNGFLLETNVEDRNWLQQLEAPTLQDEYRFIKKFWGLKWGLYVFLVRLFSFHHPIHELRAFINSIKATSIKPGKNLLLYSDFNKTPVNTTTLVSVIIPTLNRYEYLRDTLNDLCVQTYRNFEVIVTDQSDEFDASFYSLFDLNLVVIRQEEKLLWTARNNAIVKAKGEIFLFFDDDSRVAADWIEMHLKAMNYFKVDVSAGVSLAVAGAGIPYDYSFFRWADQFDSGNALVKRKVFEEAGLFDEQFNKGRQGDGEFGYRIYKKGIRSISNPKAYRIHLKAASGGLRESVGWDGWRPRHWWQPKPVPSVLYSYKKYFKPSEYKPQIFLKMLLSNVSYTMKKNKLMIYISLFLSVIKMPLNLFLYKKSERKASEMLHKYKSGEASVRYLKST